MDQTINWENIGRLINNEITFTYSPAKTASETVHFKQLSPTS